MALAQLILSLDKMHEKGVYPFFSTVVKHFHQKRKRKTNSFAAMSEENRRSLLLTAIQANMVIQGTNGRLELNKEHWRVKEILTRQAQNGNVKELEWV